MTGKLAFTTLVSSALLATPAAAVTCKSVNAKLNGMSVQASMQLTLKGKTLTSKGQMDGVAGPPRKLQCSPLKGGVFCTQEFANYTVQITTSGKKLVQTFSDANTGDAGSLVFRCDGKITMK